MRLRTVVMPQRMVGIECDLMDNAFTQVT
eukprot:SAG11_NODE_23829_length_382_cov_1.752650_1_plen_28_part_10